MREMLVTHQYTEVGGHLVVEEIVQRGVKWCYLYMPITGPNAWDVTRRIEFRNAGEAQRFWLNQTGNWIPNGALFNSPLVMMK